MEGWVEMGWAGRRKRGGWSGDVVECYEGCNEIFNGKPKTDKLTQCCSIRSIVFYIL